LLEVVLALLLFVAAVAVVSSALNSSMASVERQRFGVQASNLAATVHAELDLGLRTTESLGPEPFEPPFDQWTWQLIPAAAADQNATGEASDLSAIEVVIRSTNSAGVYRLAQTHKIVKTVVTNAPSATAGAEVAP